MGDLQPIDLPRLCELLMLDGESTKGLLRRFALSLPDMANEIEKAIGANDMELVSRLGHKLKGTAAIFRISELQNIGVRINKLDKSKEDANDLMRELRECIAYTQLAIEAL